jgi:hypothetical protein
MSSLIFIFFCFTKSSGRPSSVEPGLGTLIRYSFAIGLKTCWMSSRSALSSSDRTAWGSGATAATVGMLIAGELDQAAEGVRKPHLLDRSAAGVQ